MAYYMGTQWEHSWKEEKDKSFSNHLSFILVPRPAFEIIKVGKMWVKRKTQKNTAI